MGRGKKKYKLKEKSQPHWTVNCRITARNLRKNDLGGVIFGCKHNTIDECFSERLFGLPAPHFAYVRNIDHGLPLFLFNYSDRKLHGIFKAASVGQMNIKPYGWTVDGLESTPYAAQVQIQIYKECQPLLEDQFKPIIAENYYESRFFWFELDRAQTSKLMDLFSSSQVTVCTLFKTLPAPEKRQEGENIETPTLEAKVALSDQSKMEWGSSWDDHGWGGESQPLQAPINEEAAEKYQQEEMHLKPNSEHSYSSIVRNMRTSLPPKNWASLFKTSSISDTRKENEGIKTPTSDLDFLHPDQSNMELKEDMEVHSEDHCSSEGSRDQSNMEWGSSWDDPGWGGESQPLQAPINEEAAEEHQQEEMHLKPNSEHSHSSVVRNMSTSLPQKNWTSLFKTSSIFDTRKENAGIKTPTSELDFSHPDQSYLVLKSSKDSEENHEEDMEVHSEDTCSSEGSRDLKLKSSDLQSVVAKLLKEMEELKASHLKQIQKVSYLEQELVESKVEIQRLKDQCRMLESGSPPNTELELINEPHSNLSESIFIVGGFNGSSWLSDLDSYSPSQDLMKSLSPMSFVRSYASTAKLNGELYILGGVDGNNLWYDTVESYNPLSNQWVSRPSLNQRKGSLAGASLNNKIFAIGGANGVECLSDVEMFDLDVGMWIPTRSMLHKRFAPAAAEINGVIYVVGGYDGKDYLKSVERLDPREHSWTRLQSTNSRRGCHSLAVLNEKLYALGGYNGTRMVPTVEVFDPCMGSWMMGESMNDSRGYSAAVVLGQSIYVIGGVKGSVKDSVKGSEEIIDTVECYKEGHGWEVTNLKAIGKRCFFSAIVL